MTVASFSASVHVTVYVWYACITQHGKAPAGKGNMNAAQELTDFQNTLKALTVAQKTELSAVARRVMNADNLRSAEARADVASLKELAGPTGGRSARQHAKSAHAFVNRFKKF